MTHEPWGEGSRDIFDKYLGTKLYHKNTWKALKWKMSRHKRVGRNYASKWEREGSKIAKKDNILFSGFTSIQTFHVSNLNHFFQTYPNARRPRGRRRRTHRSWWRSSCTPTRTTRRGCLRTSRIPMTTPRGCHPRIRGRLVKVFIIHFGNNIALLK